MKHYFLILFAIVISLEALAQDTFSIVAVDPITGEVGAAGASCVDLSASPLPPDFISELIPGRGAINTQSFYHVLNQQKAYEMLQAGNTPPEILDYLSKNDDEGKPGIRQYGIVSIKEGKPLAASYTGDNCMPWAGQIVGPNYAIQGNILAGEEVLLQMEKNFNETQGSLNDKLMAAMQGAKIKGADKRCAQFGTSSLFAFIKVAQPTDKLSNLHLNLQVKTKPGSETEPIDALQHLYDNWSSQH